MTRRRIGILGALGAAALAVGASTVIGGESDEGPGNAPAPDAAVLQAERVAAPSAQRSAKRGAPKPRVFYLETVPPRDDIQPGPGGYIVEKCPKGSVAVNGYYFQTLAAEGGGTGVFHGFGLDDQGSSPAGYRKWAFYYDNVTTGEIDGVTFGIICDKDG
jgi:hypothetical protein